MEAFQERMVKEYNDLKDKVQKLREFINENPLYEKLNKKERILQAQQLAGMNIYLQALSERIIHQGFGKEVGIGGETA